MIFTAYVYKYNPTYRVTLTANPTCEAKHQIGMALWMEPGRGYISISPTSVHAHYELYVESVCVMRCPRVAGCS